MGARSWEKPACGSSGRWSTLPISARVRPFAPAAVIASLPIFLLFAFLQRYYVQGVATSGLK